MARYDQIGRTYNRYRVPDERIASQVLAALGSAQRIVNVGAGSGAYEPPGRQVVAIEPAATMIRQRPPGAAPVIQAVAEALPLATGACDAAMAVLTLHHWADWRRGVREMQRVAPTVVILTFDLDAPPFWLIEDYFPALKPVDQATMPPLAELQALFAHSRVEPLLIPADCTDGFLGAYWQRPAAYLDPGVRSAISSFSSLADLTPGLTALQADLASGAWEQRYGQLRQQNTLDLGYRLLIAKSSPLQEPIQTT